MARSALLTAGTRSRPRLRRAATSRARGPILRGSGAGAGPFSTARRVSSPGVRIPTGRGVGGAGLAGVGGGGGPVLDSARALLAEDPDRIGPEVVESREPIAQLLCPR